MQENEIILALLFISVLLFCLKWASRQRPHLLLVLTINHIKTKGEFKMISLTSTQQVPVELAPENRLGNPAPIEAGSVLVETSDSNVVEIVRDEAN